MGDEEALSFVPPSTLSFLGSNANWTRPRRQSACGEDAQKPEVDFLASFGGVTTAAASMTKVGHQEAHRRHQSLGLRRSWLDPNFSASSDLSCTSVMAISSPLTSSESVRSPFDSPLDRLDLQLLPRRGLPPFNHQAAHQDGRPSYSTNPNYCPSGR